MKNEFTEALRHFDSDGRELLVLSVDQPFHIELDCVRIMPISEQAIAAYALGYLSERPQPLLIFNHAAFLFSRSIEFVRYCAINDLPVLFVGSGAGLGAERWGRTHTNLRDIAEAKASAIENFFLPSLGEDVLPLISKWVDNPKTAYLRLLQYSQSRLPCYEASTIHDEASSGKLAFRGSVTIVCHGVTVMVAQSIKKLLEPCGLVVEMLLVDQPTQNLPYVFDHSLSLVVFLEETAGQGMFDVDYIQRSTSGGVKWIHISLDNHQPSGVAISAEQSYAMSKLDPRRVSYEILSHVT